jgi:small-conductance mechanosensitive channel
MLKLLLVLFLALGAVTAQAQQPTPPASGGPTPREAQRLIDLLQDPQQRARLIENLEAIVKAAPAAPEKPAAAPAMSLAPDSLGAQLVAGVSGWPSRLAGAAADTVQAVTDFPLLWNWARGIAADPVARMAALTALWQLALVVIGALFLEWLTRMALAGPVAALAVRTPIDDDGAVDGSWHLLRRLPFALAWLALDLIPIAVFWGAGSLFAGLVPIGVTRFAVLIVLNAYAAWRAIIAVGAMLASPASGRLRLVRVGDDAARYLMRWLRLVTTVAAVGGALASLALLFGLNPGAYDTLMRLVALIVAVLLTILVLRTRQRVAARLRAPPNVAGGVAPWRNRLAGGWHYLAIVAIIAGWIVWEAGLRQGLGGLRVLLGTAALLIAARLAAIVLLGMLDRATRLSPALSQRLPGAAARAARYNTPSRIVVNALVIIATAILLLQLWGADAFLWFEPGHLGGRVAAALITVVVAAIAAIVVWEGANAALERRLARLSGAGSAADSARLQTLLPMLRAALLGTILAVVGLTALSQIGVAIGPLLAGAGVIGIAIGFGAQKLIQDVITGMFVLFENAIQIGDWVTVAGLSGTVERLSVRNIWLRGYDGAVHIVPFSAVTSITNTNRGLGNAAVTVTVAYGEDIERVAELLRMIGGEMRGDAEFAPLISGDVELWIDAVKASGVTHAGLIPCTAAGRWPVQREFNRRLVARFKELGIELGTG